MVKIILEEETFDKFGYYPSELPQYSHKKIFVACDECSKVREIIKYNNCALCLSCGHQEKNSPNRKGKTKCICLLCGKEFKLFPSDITAGRGKYCGLRCYDAAKRGKRAYNYKFRKKIAQARSDAKRERKLGYTLIHPLEEGEVGHHVTDEYVIGIPMEVHEKLSGYKRIKHRALVLEWLKDNDIKKYVIVLNVLTKEP